MNLSRSQKAASIAVMVIVLAAEGAVLAYWGHGTWQERVSFGLEIIGFYGIGLGFAAHSEALNGVKFIIEEMTSPNLFLFVSGNLKFLSIIFFVSSLGTSPGKTKSSAVISLGGCLFVILVPLTLVYSIFHVFIVMPITYTSYVLVSAVVESVQYSNREVKITDKATRGQLSIRRIVADNPIEAKSFLIGLPAIVLSLVIHFGEWFF
jgi:hypothetical protein